MRSIADDHAAERQRWPDWMRTEFKLMGPVAVCIGGMREAISGLVIHHADGSRTSYPHNRPFRAVKAAISESWKDTVSGRLDQFGAVEQGMLARVWVPNGVVAQTLADAIRKTLAVIAIEGLATHSSGKDRPMRREFVGIDASVSDNSLEAMLIETAGLHIIEAWTDGGLTDHLARRHHAREAAKLKALCHGSAAAPLQPSPAAARGRPA